MATEADKLNVESIIQRLLEGVFKRRECPSIKSGYFSHRIRWLGSVAPCPTGSLGPIKEYTNKIVNLLDFCTV